MLTQSDEVDQVFSVYFTQRYFTYLVRFQTNMVTKIALFENIQCRYSSLLISKSLASLLIHILLKAIFRIIFSKCQPK